MGGDFPSKVNMTYFKNTIIEEVAKWAGLGNFISEYSRIPAENITLPANLTQSKKGEVSST